MARTPIFNDPFHIEARKRTAESRKKKEAEQHEEEKEPEEKCRQLS